MSVRDDIKRALELAHRRGSPPRSPVVRATVDQYGLVRGLDAQGGVQMFCHLDVWNDMRCVLGCSTLEPEPVHCENADALYGIKRGNAG